MAAMKPDVRLERVLHLLQSSSDVESNARVICDLWADELMEVRSTARNEARLRAYGVARERLRKAFALLEDEMLAMEAHPGRHGNNKRQEIAAKSRVQEGVALAIFELDALRDESADRCLPATDST
jgi:hypothetical protein